MGNYNKGIIKQIEELTERSDNFEQANKGLRRENRELRQKFARLEKSIDQIIARAVEKATAPLYERIATLEMENERKDKEILRLKAQINKDSSNSSMPPSANGFKKIPNNREKSKKKKGGQKGHKGTTLTIPPNLEDLIKEGKAEHKVIDLTGGAKEHIKRWIIDIKTVTTYTEYRCPLTEMPGISYGTNLKAYATILLNEGFISLARVSEFLEQITHGQITASPATLERFNREIGNKIDLEQLKNDLLNGEVLHVDETALRSTERVNGDELEVAEKTTFDVVIRTHSNATTTLYTVNPRKDDEGIERDGIIPNFHGIHSHDHDRKYYKYGNIALHATCCAHLSRELKGIAELFNIPWAAKFRKFINEMNAYKESTTKCPADKLSEFEQRYDELVVEGVVILGNNPELFGFDELRKMVNRLTQYKQNYMLFIKNYKAPFTNNLAERDLRPCKTKQKISGCFRAWDGVVCFAKIRSFISTQKKRSLNLLLAFAHLLAVPC